jgi:hypothetical protein
VEPFHNGNAYRMPVRYAHCRSVSTLTLTTPCYAMSASRTVPPGPGIPYADGIKVLLLGGAGAAVEHEED